jgi:hypothetical protein
MSWYKIVFGFVLMAGAVVIWFMLMRRIGASKGSGIDTKPARKRKGAADNGPNELERIVAAHREKLREQHAGAATPATPATAATAPLGGHAASAPAMPPDPGADFPPGPLRDAARLGLPAHASAATLAARAAALAGAPHAEPPLLSDPNAAANDPRGSDQTIPGMPARPWLRADPGPRSAQPRPLLKASHKLLYLLAKSALADHHVFAQVPLTAIAPDLGFVQPGHLFALVVCRADFTVAAVVDLRPAAEAWHLNELRDALRVEAGIAHVIFATEYLPRRNALRKLILSPPTATGAAAAPPRPTEQRPEYVEPSDPVEDPQPVQESR